MSAASASGGPLRVGVMGAGWVATTRHIPSYRRHPDAEVTAVYDRRPERAEAAAAKSGATSYRDLDAFFGQGLDVVSVCTPPWLHAEHAIEALSRGVHVFSEKPMALNAADAQAMADAADRAGRLLCVSHNLLFSRSLRRADALIGTTVPQYVLGLQLSSLRRRLPDWYSRLPGGLLLDEAPHMLYILRHFLGPLTLHSARATFAPSTGLPATAEVLLGGTIANGQVTMVFDTPLSEWQLGVVTPERMVAIDLFRDVAVDIGSDGAHRPLDILATSGRAMLSHASGVLSSGTRYGAGRLLWGHDVLIARFVNAIRGKGPVPVDVADAVEIVRLSDSILADLGVVRP